MSAFFLILTLLATNIKADNTIHHVNKTYQDLSQSNTWKSLLHYRSFFGSEKSGVIDSNFFISKYGSFDPLSELEDNIKLAKNADQKYYCQFPARIEFMFQNKLIDNTLYNKLESCTELQSWISNQDVTSLSLVYASGYLSNPASFYGHTLLKLDNNVSHSPLLDTSINYGAAFLETNPFTYIVKGLFGGYKARYSYADFFHHNANYGVIENRDLWILKLNLNQHQQKLLMFHLWEILPFKFTYYFTSRNCAFNIAELLELTGHKKDTKGNAPVIHPLDEFLSTQRYTNQKAFLVPSQLRTIRNNFRDLNYREKRWIEKYARILGNTEKHELNEFSNTSKSKLFSFLIQYLQHRKRNEETEDYDETIKHILTKRLELPVNKSQSATLVANDLVQGVTLDAAQGYESIFTSIDYSTDLQESEWVLSYRPAGFDTLTPHLTHPAFAAVELGTVTFSYNENHLKLKQLDLIKIFSPNVDATGLPGDEQFSWEIGAFYSSNTFDTELSSFGHSWEKVFEVQASVGRSWNINKYTIGFMLAGAQGQDNFSGHSVLQSFAKFGTAYKRDPISLQLTCYDKKGSQFDFCSVQSRVSMMRDLKLEIGYESLNQISSLGVRYFLSSGL